MVALVALLPWDGIAERFERYPCFDWVMPEHTRTVRSPVPLRVDGAGGFHLLGGDSAIVHRGPSGEPAGRTPLAGGQGRLVDFCCDPTGNCVVLWESDAAGEKHLSGVAADGVERWRHGVPGGAQTLLSDDADVYVADSPSGSLSAFSISSGDGGATIAAPPGAGRPFLGGEHLLWVVFDEERTRRGIVARRLDGAGETRLAGELEHYAWLVHPFGASAVPQLYTWQDGRVARLGLDGTIDVADQLNGIAVRASDGAIFTSHEVPDGLAVVGAGEPLTLPAPAGHRLIFVDDADRLYVLGGEAPDNPGELRVYSTAGHLESSGPPPEDLAATDCRLPDPGAWKVQPGGAIAIAVPTPTGLALVRVGD